MQNKPELLLPAGNPESFSAALQAGADAVYLGLPQFNARVRAGNFSQLQLISVLNESRKNNVKVYVTLNTVIKNAELELLIEYLHFLSEVGTDAIIVQDWGVFYIAKNFFPNLKIHASTQMVIHNSVGVKFLSEKGFARTLLARELTMKELENVVRNAEIETEVFIHGALCYSFSGLCLFSSYNGGRGANRGMCAQPCRRAYGSKINKEFIFNLKDNQLVEYLPQLAKIGVTSLKVEGRMKPGEYTFRVGSAYRMALDDETKTKQAIQMLGLDFGRQKTSYFAGGNIKNSVSGETSTGLYLGEVIKTEGKRILFSSVVTPEPGFRLRFNGKTSANPVFLVVKKPLKQGNLFSIENDDKTIETGSSVFLTKLQDQKFQFKTDKTAHIQFRPVSVDLKKAALKSLNFRSEKDYEKLYFRIASTDWLKLINFNELDGLFLSFSLPVWSKLFASKGFEALDREKVYIELPKFMAENTTVLYEDLIQKLVNVGFRNFLVGHISQKLLLPPFCRVIATENIYVFNDAAARFILNEVDNFIYPFETDFETLASMKCKSGIVPVYFYPELFYSRMPVRFGINPFIESDFSDVKYRRYRKNGITIIVPDRAVSVLQHKNQLLKMGFSNFLIDVSYDQFSKNRLKTLKTRFIKSEQIQPSTKFNFTKGLK